MPHILVRHKVADYPTWKTAFDSAFQERQHGGELGHRIFRNADDASDVTVLFEWESLDRARSFIHAEAGQPRTQAGLVGPPDLTIVSEVHQLRRTAAD